MLPSEVEKIIRGFLPRRLRLGDQMCLAAIDMTSWDPDHYESARYTIASIREKSKTLRKIARRCPIPELAKPRAVVKKYELGKYVKEVIGLRGPRWSFSPAKAVFVSLRLWRRGVDVHKARAMTKAYEDALFRFVYQDKKCKRRLREYNRAVRENNRAAERYHRAIGIRNACRFNMDEAFNEIYGPNTFRV